MQIFIAIIIPAIAGFILFNLVTKIPFHPLLAGVYVMLGLGIMAWWSSLVVLVGGRLFLFIMAAPCLALIVHFMLSKRFTGQNIQETIRAWISSTMKQPLSFWIVKAFGIILFTVIIGYSLSITISTPFEMIDAYAVWGLMAKAYYLTDGFPAQYYDMTQFQAAVPYPKMDDTLKYPLIHPYNTDYPILMPLTQVWLLKWYGEFDEGIAKLLPFTFYVAFLLTLGWLLVQLSPKPKNKFLANLFSYRVPHWLFVLAVATIPKFRWFGVNGYAEMPLCAWLLAATGFGMLWLKEGRQEYVYLTGLFLGFSALTKNEGFVLSFVFYTMLLVIKPERIADSKQVFSPVKRLIIVLALVGLLFFIAVPWKAFTMIHGSANLHSSQIEPSFHFVKKMLGHLHYYPMLLKWMYREMTTTAYWHGFWIFLAIALLSRASAYKNRSVILGIGIMGFYFLGVSVMLLTAPSEKEAFTVVHESFDRVYLQMVPVGTLLIWLLMTTCINQNKASP